jgi:transposase
MDRATPHTSQMTQTFIESQPRLHVFYLPPYSPEWNPDEKVWNHLKTQELEPISDWQQKLIAKFKADFVGGSG